MSKIQGFFFKDFSNSYIPNILEEMYLDKVYDSYFSGRSNLDILDIGANVGLFTFYAYPYASRIFSIEPSSFHMESLNYMVRFNGFDNKVITIKKAVSHVNGEATFYHNHNLTTFSLRPEVNSKPQEKETVQTITLDTLFDEQGITHIDFMKLDVEGSEMEIVGSAGFDKVAQKIDTIMGENHVWNNTNPHQLQAAFEDRGFNFKWIPAKAQLFFASRL